MKKLILIVTMIVVLVFALPVGAVETEVDNTAEGTEYTSADTVIKDTTVGETTVTETTIVETTVAETTVTETAEAVITEALIEINEDTSFSELVLAIADKFGISVEEAERMVGDIRELGDKYLSDSDLWGQITADMDAYPAKWTVIGLVAALILFLIGLLIKRVISDATAISRLKVAVTDIRRGLLGDEDGGEQGDVSVCSLIKEKNMQIEQLRSENSALRESTEELKKSVQALNEVINKAAANSDTSLKLTEESTLRIMQLLKLTLDRDIPKTSKEARALWYSAAQNRIKEIYQEGAANGGGTEQDGEAEKTGQKV